MGISPFILLFLAGACNGILYNMKHPIAMDAKALKTLATFDLASEIYSPRGVKKLQRLIATAAKNDLQCYRDVLRVVLDFTNTSMSYSARVVDSMGKLGSGIMQGNTRWLGSFEECVDTVQHLNGEEYFRGKYCKVNAQIVLGNSSLIGVTLGQCVPQSCNETQTATVINTVLSPLQIFQVSGDSCLYKVEWGTGEIVSMVLIVVLVVLCIIGILLDLIARVRGNAFNGFLAKSFLCFSWVTNTEKLLKTKTSDQKLACLHGIRVLSIWWVVLGHSVTFMNLVSDNIVGFATNIVTRFSFQVIMNGVVSVDTFFFLSGFLIAYLTLKELQKREGKLNWPLLYFHRFWRLTPTYMFCVMFLTTIPRLMVYAPLSRMLDNSHVLGCQKYWWANLLYINNFVPQTISTEGFCVSWAWYLANDMQFFVISPIILIILYKSAVAGLLLITALLVTTVSLTGYFAYEWNISPLFIQPPGTNSDYQNMLYTRPYFRLAPYLVGLLLGFLLNKKQDFKLNKVVVLIGWLVAAAINLSVLYGLSGYVKDFQHLPRDVAAFYLAVNKLAWSLGVAWVVFACFTGNAGPVNVILSWRGWIPLARLSYSLYLVHPIVIVPLVLDTRVPVHTTDSTLIIYFLGFLVLSTMAAYVLVMLVETPTMLLEKQLLSPLVDKHRKGPTDDKNKMNGTPASVTNGGENINTDNITLTSGQAKNLSPTEADLNNTSFGIENKAYEVNEKL